MVEKNWHPSYRRPRFLEATGYGTGDRGTRVRLPMGPRILPSPRLPDMIWVPGYEGIAGNKTADQLARTGSEEPFIEPEPPMRYLNWSCQDSDQGLD
ncbi:hypothetical protein B7P43_G16840 [Cryptotermes secundus]|uniref:RNase H type-1 domain-containing protein n=1 Tax=Cryptotermes secundus TaxID=105785 RepID=A0A2J7PTE1_9NEOP|nr:hypothetical protein B7P43_G16840 [Cryptotermes secundus]